LNAEAVYSIFSIGNTPRIADSARAPPRTLGKTTHQYQRPHASAKYKTPPPKAFTSCPHTETLIAYPGKENKHVDPMAESRQPRRHFPKRTTTPASLIGRAPAKVRLQERVSQGACGCRWIRLPQRVHARATTVQPCCETSGACVYCTDWVGRVQCTLGWTSVYCSAVSTCE
jgi:hypothetical protein